MQTKGIYIYGFVSNVYNAEMFRLLENSGIYAIPLQNISAIVSYRENRYLNYSDKETLGQLLVHHQKTIENLMEKGFTMIIPMRLGTIVGSKEEVYRILTNGYDIIIETLNKIGSLTELDVAVTWANFSEILKDIANDPEIKTMKNDLLKKADTLTQMDQMKIGMLIQAKLKEKNAQIESKIIDFLTPYCLNMKTHEVIDDRMVTNSALLVDRKKTEQFEKAIEELDEVYKGMLDFKLVGPLPCYSFYTVEVQELNLERVEQAKKILELKEETSESEIKKAYQLKARLFHPDSSLENGDKDNFNKINKAYHTLLEYSAVARTVSENGFIPLTKEKMIDNLFLVKIKA